MFPWNPMHNNQTMSTVALLFGVALFVIFGLRKWRRGPGQNLDRTDFGLIITGIAFVLFFWDLTDATDHTSGIEMIAWLMAAVLGYLGYQALVQHRAVALFANISGMVASIMVGSELTYDNYRSIRAQVGPAADRVYQPLETKWLDIAHIFQDVTLVFVALLLIVSAINGYPKLQNRLKKQVKDKRQARLDAQLANTMPAPSDDVTAPIDTAKLGDSKPAGPKPADSKAADTKDAKSGDAKLEDTKLLPPSSTPATTTTPPGGSGQPQSNGPRPAGSGQPGGLKPGGGQGGFRQDRPDRRDDRRGQGGPGQSNRPQGGPGQGPSSGRPPGDRPQGDRPQGDRPQPTGAPGGTSTTGGS